MRRRCYHRPLTDLERSALILAAQGYTQAESGRILSYSRGSIRNALGRVYLKYGVCTETQAVVHAWMVGDIPQTVGRERSG